jgi:hypothetical protein
MCYLVRTLIPSFQFLSCLHEVASPDFFGFPWREILAMPLFLASMVYYLSLLDNVATDKPELIGKMNREKKA